MRILAVHSSVYIRPPPPPTMPLHIIMQVHTLCACVCVCRLFCSWRSLDAPFVREKVRVIAIIIIIIISCDQIFYSPAYYNGRGTATMAVLGRLIQYDQTYDVLLILPRNVICSQSTVL